MFLISLLTFLYGFTCLFIVLIVLMQRGKSGLGIGYAGGMNQSLFGGSGGQEFFQKITWGCLVILLAGSLTLSVLRGKYNKSSFSSPIVRHAKNPVNENK